MPALLLATYNHACCTVRGALVVLGGAWIHDCHPATSRVEILSGGQEGEFVDLPHFDWHDIEGASAVVVEESDSATGQVLLLGGYYDYNNVGENVLSTVLQVDLASGACTLLPTLHTSRFDFAAVRLPDGRVACTGGFQSIEIDPALTSAEVWGPPTNAALDAARIRTVLPALNVGRGGCRGCVMSDGRLAVLGGRNSYDGRCFMSSCEALRVDKDEHWSFLPPMRHPRAGFACAAVAGCIIVAGGYNTKSVEAYDEVLDRWFQLPCVVPIDEDYGRLGGMGSALM